MPHRQKLNIDGLKKQLEELQEVYNEMINNNKKNEALKQIKKQIRALQKAIATFLTTQ